ncbi:PREDICTED: arginine/serine-rich protein PNISR-like isoform X2 [Dinoponera quadriceps]|uniref:Arginine/serine-rich protein PNISR-like isoform X2 n=1 Tax=Dinoponera quadriceps TaxID=609295 RepID=A0A6P3WS44_DINQU|nr:PREDICTED: arginine/serine-rich protein PNISR-like isoform X2 [Dinoponera quadriceps]
MKMSGEMFEGEDYPTQWALNPSAYQNMSNDQVDWAALAQQWIKMKETIVPPAPPPPAINTMCAGNDGSGEAPMDMDTKDDDVPPAPPAPNISGSAWNQWNQWDNWNSSTSGSWEWGGVPPPGVTVGPDGKPIGLPAVPVVPPAPAISTTTDFNTPPPAPSMYSYNSVSPAQSYNQVTNAYWSGEPPNTVPPQPPGFMKGIRHMSRASHMRGIDPARCRDDREKTPEEDTTTTIDAAKRRQLPAWLREGLEKMEKEKQKAVEKERLEILRKQELEARKQAEDEARAVLDPSKSKFDSDSEKEAEQDFDTGSARGQQSEKSYDRTPDIVLRPRKSRFRDADSPESHTAADESPTAVASTPPSVPKRSREEIMQDIMLMVRRSLTEILLEVTNEEIGVVCREVWSHARTKVPAGETPVASLNNMAPLAQITRKLGLGIYGDSNSESDEEQSEYGQVQDDDSDEELMETVRRRQQAFRKTEEEIEARLAEEDEREEQQLRYEEQYNKQQENHTGNTSCRESVDEKETVNNQREASETLSSDGQSPQAATAATTQNNAPADSATKANSTVSGSADSESSSSDSTSSSESSSRESSKKTNSKRSAKQQQQQQSREREHRRRKSRSKSKLRNDSSRLSRSHSSDSRSRKRRSRSRSLTKSRKGYRSRSSSNHRSSGDGADRKHRSRSRNRKRVKSRSASTGRKWSKKSRSRSRERRRSRSRSNVKRRRMSRSMSRSRSRGSHRRSRSYVSRSRRRSRSKSRDRSRKSRSKSSHRDGKKSSHRYRN